MDLTPPRPVQSAAARALGDLVAAFHVEASRHPDTRATLIRLQADALDDHRVMTLRGELSEDDAFAWLDSGRLSLVDIVRSRVWPDDPAMQAVRDRISDE